MKSATEQSAKAAEDLKAAQSEREELANKLKTATEDSEKSADELKAVQEKLDAATGAATVSPLPPTIHFLRISPLHCLFRKTHAVLPQFDMC